MSLPCRTAIAALYAAAAATAPASAGAQEPAVTLIDTAVLMAPRLGESSGIAASRHRPGVFWTHNDSGDGPILYATDSTGADLGYVTVAWARNFDWEDLGAGPCTRSSGTCLFVGDVGDNGARRPVINVYVLPEPEPPSNPGDTLRSAAVEDIIVLRYPDRPHDAEAIAIVGGSLFEIGRAHV